MRLLLLLLPALLAASSASITWEADYDAAFERAANENKVIFVALNMDGEAANDRLAEDVYHEKLIVELSQHTVNLIGSRFEHGAKCKRFDGVQCADHQSHDKRIRAEILKASPDTSVVAPQHLFVQADGTVLLSVPYEVRAKELAWCFVTAINKANPEAKMAMPSGAKAPRRLIQDGVLEPGTGDAAISPLSSEEVEALIEEIRNGMRAGERAQAMLRLIATDDERVIEYLKVELGDVRLQRRAGAFKRVIRAMGAVSPASFAPLVEDFLKHPDDEIRMEAVVALEQLGNPKSAKELRSVVKKEDSAAIRAQMMRAIGIVGAEDKSARSTVMKAAKDKKDEELAANALFALGMHAADDKVWAQLEESLQEGSARLKQAAALGLALGRSTAHLERLRDLRKAEADKSVAATYDAVLAVLEGGPIAGLAEAVAEVTGNDIPRPRFFGGQTGAEDAPSE